MGMTNRVNPLREESGERFPTLDTFDGATPEKFQPASIIKHSVKCRLEPVCHRDVREKST
jgi:hypothetical protein